MPGQHIVTGSSDAWPENGAQAERSLNTGWILDQRADGAGSFATNCSPSSSGLTFTSTGDGTTGSGNRLYSVGRRARIIQGGGSTTYAFITSASVAAGVTTVVVSPTTFATTALSTGAITSAAVGPVSRENDLNPMNTSGDMIYGSTVAGAYARLAGGSTGSLMRMLAGIPAWLAAGSSGSLLQVSAASPAWLAAGDTGSILRTTGGMPAWLAAGTTGSLLRMSGDVPSWLALGADNTVLGVVAGALAFTNVVRALDKVVTSTTVVSSTAETTIYTKTIAGNTIGASGATRLKLAGTLLNNAGGSFSVRIRIKFGATTLFDGSPLVQQSANRRQWFLDFHLWNASATNAQRAAAFMRIAGQAASSFASDEGSTPYYMTGSDGAATEDTTANKDLVITAVLETNSASFDIVAREALLDFIP